MAKTYTQLTRDIEALQARADAARKQEMAGVVSRIKEAIVVYGLTAGDLGLDADSGASRPPSELKSAPAVSKKPQATPKTRSPAKYRDAAGNAWTGMGPKPGWLKAALAAGQTLEALAVPGTAVKTASIHNGSGGARGAAAKTGRSTPKPQKSVLPAKYRDDAGHTWSGRGPKPGWLKEAMATGKSLDDLMS